MFYTSRSAVEAYQDCHRYRYNQYYLEGKGVVAKSQSIPLVTGSTIHRGIEHMLQRVRINQPVNVDIAVQEAINEYMTVCDKEGFRFSGKGTDTDKQQWFTYNEQKALAEALLRSWAIVELPRIQAKYKVLAVEREILPIEIAPGVMFQAKVDAEFQDKETEDYINYSIKSVKQWNEAAENSYKGDLQGLTEMWAVEEDSRIANSRLDGIVSEIVGFGRHSKYPPKNLETIMGYLLKQKESKKVSAVRFCILVKGARYKSTYDTDVEGLLVTHNPLIRGYKMITPSSIEYAHSFSYPNPENKSGFGRLGKGWEPFSVWESNEFGVKEWIEAIHKGEIQAECGDVISKHCFVPVEYWRNERELEVAINEIKWQEIQIKTALDIIKNGNLQIDHKDNWPNVLAQTFPHYRKHCEFHFGGPCEYKELCWNPTVSGDALGSGLYQVRMPHHEGERRG